MATAIILGGGIAGTAAGLALARAGWRFRIYERASRLEAVGAALSLWPNAIEGLRRLGMLDAVLPHGAPIDTVAIADHRGRPILAARSVSGPAILISRSALQSALTDALPENALVLCREAVEVVASAGAVTIRFADGSSETADILIDASGLRSVTAGPGTLSYRGYGGVMALSDPVADAGLGGLAAEYWGRGERFGVFELTEGRRYWFYMRDQPAGTDAPDHAYVLARAGGWPAVIGRAIAATPANRLIPVSIHARPAPRKLVVGRILRVGDAAHAMEPNLGQGACQAIEDAVALETLARDYPPDALLRAFEARRLVRVAKIVRRAAYGKYGAHGSPVSRWAVRQLLRRTPQSTLDRLARAVEVMPG